MLTSAEFRDINIARLGHEHIAIDSKSPSALAVDLYIVPVADLLSWSDNCLGSRNTAPNSVLLGLLLNVPRQ